MRPIRPCVRSGVIKTCPAKPHAISQLRLDVGLNTSGITVWEFLQQGRTLKHDCITSLYVHMEVRDKFASFRKWESHQMWVKCSATCIVSPLSRLSLCYTVRRKWSTEKMNIETVCASSCGFLPVQYPACVYISYRSSLGLQQHAQCSLTICPAMGALLLASPLWDPG